MSFSAQEEQENEIEALQSIYPLELSILSPGPPAHLSLLLECDLGHSLTLDITYTPNYPETLPEWTFVNPSKEITDQDLELLTTQSQQFAQESLGMAMIFSLAEYIKEQLIIIIHERLKAQEEEQERILLAQELAEKERLAGTKVTQESFQNWKSEFAAEIRALKKSGATLSPAMQAFAVVSKLFQDTSKNGKLTGRQLFERDSSLATGDMALMDETDVAVDFTLFEGLEDLDLEDEQENQVLAGLRDEDD